MGNAIGGAKKKAKIMKIDGETFKLKAPAPATDVLKDYPAGYVLLESEQVKRCGIRAQPEEGLMPGKIYFLVEMPKFPEAGRSQSLPPRTSGSSAKERLELLRQKSDINMRSGSVRMKMRLPRAEIQKLMTESKDESEVAHRILQLCLRD